MKTVTVNSEEEAIAAIKENEAAGLRLAAHTQVIRKDGTKYGWLTFCPREAFKEVPAKLFPDGETDKKLEG